MLQTTLQSDSFYLSAEVGTIYMYNVSKQPVVQQPDTGMCVVGGRCIMCGDNLVKAADIFGKVFNRHGGISHFHECYKLLCSLVAVR